jgi:cysteine desulfurase
MIYLDYNATTPVHPDVRAAIAKALEEFGNPSSGHALGRAARATVDAARCNLAQMLGAREPGEIVFTSGATEANNLALLGSSETIASDRRHIIVSAIEHSSVTGPAQELARRGWEVSFLAVESDGRVKLDALKSLLASRQTGMVSIMHANNELGTIQPVAEIGALAKRYGALFHVDAAQSFGKIPVNVDAIQADLVTIAGHKMYAPKGIGALFVRKDVKLKPSYFGAGQESGMRPGTENVAYIGGLDAAAKLMQRSTGQWNNVSKLRDRLESGLIASIPGLVVNGSRVYRLPNTLHISLPVGSARALLDLLKEDIAMSPGAACHSGAGHSPSGVLQAIGANAQRSEGAIRISLGLETTEREVDATLHHLPSAYASYLASREH